MIYVFQILIVLGFTALKAMRAYNSISDPMERESGKTYGVPLFVNQNLINISKHFISGIMLLIVLNEGGMPLINIILKMTAHTNLAELISKEGLVVGDMMIAAASGLYGEKLIDKLK